MRQYSRIENNIRRIEIVAIVLEELVTDAEGDDELDCLDGLGHIIETLVGILKMKERFADV